VNPWLSVVIPTIGRDTLEQTIASLDAQPESAGLEVLVVADTFGGLTPRLEHARDLVKASRHHWLEYDAGFHMVGQPQRTFGARLASAPWVWFSQDDNIAAEDSLAAIEMVCDNERKQRPLFFRFRSPWGELLWREPHLALGNIDADCLVFPRTIAQDVHWGLRYEGDYDAAQAAYELAQGDVAWVDEIISIARAGVGDYWWLTS
jgi:hypothetical protein